MLAPSPQSKQPVAPALVTEAEAIANLLLELDVPLTVRLGADDNQLLFQVSTDTPSGAVDVMRIASARFDDDEDFREAMIAYVGSIGDYVSGAPCIRVDLKADPAPYVVDALQAAGLDVVLHRDAHLSWAAATLNFHARAEKIAPNAHLLMRLAADRYQNDPDFAGQLADYLDACDTHDVPD